MDPDQAWKDLADAYQDGDHERIREIAFALLTWKGYPPTITRHQKFDRVVVEYVCKGLLDLPF